MAIVELRLSDSDFWNIEPKRLFIMISEHLDMLEYKAMVQAIASSGGEFQKRIKSYGVQKPEEIGYVHIDCF